MDGRNRMRNGIIGAAALLAAASLALIATRPAGGDEKQPAAPPPAAAENADANADMARAAAEMATAATTFLNSLTPEQRQAASFEFKDDERLNWHFVPRERKGLAWGQMTPDQQHLAHALLASGLSQRGYADAAAIMSLEQVLAQIEQGRGPKRDPAMYFVSIFGTPSADGTWGWRVEGHHLSLNFTVAGGKAAAGAPSFYGTNPAEVRDGPRKGLRALAEEEDWGFKLVRSLNDEQRKKAVIAEKAPDDIITGAQRKAEPGEPQGIAAGELTAEQQGILRDLVQLYAHRQRGELAHADWAQIEQAGWEKVKFAWAGPTEPGVGHYYRIHGPTFLVEFDNIQNNANHVHTVWRDLKDDFGGDLLRKHYEAEHK